ncbi:ester cyclase [Microbacterium caowuchunii]|uniref:ester cyclase n=1 Tax=Microbacterium caowuchunii TaxID=2614638 RepID=UPI00193100FA|nr:ester cyclase [Microbacterium caowuchunii]
MNETMSATPALKVVERILHEGFAGGDVTVVDELCSPDLIEHQFGMEGTGEAAIAKIKKGITEVHRGMPDLTFTIQGWAERDDIVWVLAEGTATNTGPFFGPPTGKRVRFTVIDVARVRDGRIVEHWGVPDRFAIMTRMGRLGAPSDGRPSAAL